MMGEIRGERDTERERELNPISHLYVLCYWLGCRGVFVNDTVQLRQEERRR